MDVYGYFRSSAAFRVRIALNLKGLSPDLHFIHLRKGDQNTPAYRAINPQGLIPALVDDDGTCLTQSLAIIEYLDERHPHPPLLPTDPAARARVRAVALAIACDIHPLNNLKVLNHLRDAFGIDDAGRQRWYAHWIAEGLTAVEALLAASPDTGPFCHGASPTIADIVLVPQVFNAQRMDCPLDAYPTIRTIVERCRALPAFHDAEPARQPDAEP
ncbi:maleylpyruvate isomerase [Azospirillum fermentarium]|uniref:maleylacetoacetate isomerase n=1 Tax=Azospirillum fermentarium TaxID=1233114 RepID=UPI002226246D|nr:maleylacetoacetate isomerase [Azospirillum fermentarium]MCW2248846.1 maleylpyruvate isomerase [Azospirillum fermentarium]